MLEGVLAFHHAYRELGGEAVIPDRWRTGGDELRGWSKGSRWPGSYILTSPWHVPLRWFICSSRRSASWSSL